MTLSLNLSLGLSEDAAEQFCTAQIREFIITFGPIVAGKLRKFDITYVLRVDFNQNQGMSLFAIPIIDTIIDLAAIHQILNVNILGFEPEAIDISFGSFSQYSVVEFVDEVIDYIHVELDTQVNHTLISYGDGSHKLEIRIHL